MVVSGFCVSASNLISQWDILKCFLKTMGARTIPKCSRDFLGRMSTSRSGETPLIMGDKICRVSMPRRNRLLVVLA